jgi:putative endonuclease
MREYYVYILASKPRGTLYIGVTNDLVRRVYEHKNEIIEGFTKRYGVHLLVHYEQCKNVASVIWREKRLKKWNREWKLQLIERENPEWRDLYLDLVDSMDSPPSRRMT